MDKIKLKVLAVDEPDSILAVSKEDVQEHDLILWYREGLVCCISKGVLDEELSNQLGSGIRNKEDHTTYDMAHLAKSTGKVLFSIDQTSKVAFTIGALLQPSGPRL